MSSSLAIKPGIVMQVGVVALLAATIPFWLPTFLGGATSYHFVLTNSMKGSVDPGSFVVLRRSDSYHVGDVVAFRQDLGGGEGPIILHRIIEVLPGGSYLIKGDAAAAEEDVQREFVIGKMVLALPYLGYIPGAFGHFPHLMVVGLLGFMLLPGLKSKGAPLKGGRRKILYALTFGVIIGTFSFFEVGPAAYLGPLPLLMILIGFLIITILAGTMTNDRRMSSLVEVNCLLIMTMAITSLPLQELLEGLRKAVGV